MTRLVERRAWALATRWRGAALSLTLIADAAATRGHCRGKPNACSRPQALSVMTALSRSAAPADAGRTPTAWVSGNDAVGLRSQTLTHSLGLAAAQLSKGMH